MDPIALIKEDHRRIEALFEEYDAFGTDAYAQRGDLAAMIIGEFEAHIEMEEVIAYPAFKKAFGNEDDRKVELAFAGHEVAKNLMEEVRTLEVADPQFDEKIQLLKQNVVYHIEEEEETLFPTVEQVMSGEAIAQMGEEMQAYKDVREEAALDSLTEEDF